LPSLNWSRLRADRAACALAWVKGECARYAGLAVASCGSRALTCWGCRRGLCCTVGLRRAWSALHWTQSPRLRTTGPVVNHGGHKARLQRRPKFTNVASGAHLVGVFRLSWRVVARLGSAGSGLCRPLAVSTCDCRRRPGERRCCCSLQDTRVGGVVRSRCDCGGRHLDVKPIRTRTSWTVSLLGHCHAPTACVGVLPFWLLGAQQPGACVDGADCCWVCSFLCNRALQAAGSV